MSEVIKVDTSVSRPFLWRDRRGEFHRPCDMTTHHVFHTWLMLWNHAAPPDKQVLFHHHYKFPPMYTPAYVVAAFKALSQELMNRTDLEPYMVEALRKIEGAQVKRVEDEA